MNNNWCVSNKKGANGSFFMLSTNYSYVAKTTTVDVWISFLLPETALENSANSSLEYNCCWPSIADLILLAPTKA